MRVITVQASLHEEDLARFVAASIDNGRSSVGTEPGCRRFDIFHDADHPNRVGFNEVYDNDDDVTAHGESEHFARWLSATEGLAYHDMVWATCRNLFPGDALWDAAREGVDQSAPAGDLHVHHARISVGPDDVDRFIDSVTEQARAAVGNEEGLLRFDVNQNLEDPKEIWLYKVHNDPASARRHASTPYTVAHLERFGDLYLTSSPAPISGPNIWPPDDWQWASRTP